MTPFLSVTNRNMSVILRPSFKNISTLAEKRTNVSHNTSHKTPKAFNSFFKKMKSSFQSPCYTNLWVAKFYDKVTFKVRRFGSSFEILHTQIFNMF